MTISSTNRSAAFIGNGAAATFPFAFMVFAATDLEVIEMNPTTNTNQTMVLNTDYTIALNADQNDYPGGSITLLAGALAVGYELLIASNIPQTQNTDLTNSGGFYPEVITAALDRLTALVQQLGVLFSGPLSGTQDGVNSVFTMTNYGNAISSRPRQVTVWRNFPIISGVGYTLGPLDGQITFATAPATDDVLFAQGVM